MLKMAPVLRYTEFSPSSCLAGNFPQVVRLHVADKVWDNHFELLDCRWLASNYMGKYIAPKWEVHGWQIWRVWGPYVFSLPGNHSSSKLRQISAPVFKTISTITRHGLIEKKQLYDKCPDVFWLLWKFRGFLSISS